MNTSAYKVSAPLDPDWTAEAFAALFSSHGEAQDDCSCPDVCRCSFDTRGCSKINSPDSISSL